MVCACLLTTGLLLGSTSVMSQDNATDVLVRNASLSDGGELVVASDEPLDETGDGNRRTTLPLGLRFTSDAVVCSHTDGEAPIRFLVFQKVADKHAYGVYALSQEKNHIPVPFPLSGNSIAYPNRDHRDALVHLLTLAGVRNNAAANLVTESAAEWFGDGFRMFFVLPARLESDSGPENAKPFPVVLVRIDLPAAP